MTFKSISIQVAHVRHSPPAHLSSLALPEPEGLPALRHLPLQAVPPAALGAALRIGRAGAVAYAHGVSGAGGRAEAALLAG